MSVSIAQRAESDTVFRPVEFVGGLNIEEQAILDNIEANCARDLPRVSLRKACVCGGGPSLADHLEEIREKQGRGFHVYALNNAGKFLRADGIMPNAQFIIDARPCNSEFVEDVHPKITYFIGTQCDPVVFDTVLANPPSLRPPVHMVNVAAVDGAIDLIGRLNPGATVLSSQPTVGLQALNLMDVLGYRIVHLYGYDSSHRDDGHHAYEQAVNDDLKVLEWRFNDRGFKTNAAMAMQAEQFGLIYSRYVQRGMALEVFGDGLLPEIWRFHESIRLNGTEGQREAVKYQKMWQVDEYRKMSPGEDLHNDILRHIEAREAETVIDFGVGPGRLAKALLDAGYDVTGIDIAMNCLDPALRDKVPLVVTNLWEPLAGDMVADFGICTDVMEHIAPAHVDAVLDNIRRSVPACYFSISFTPDAFGAAIGEQLHLTVQPQEWWLAKLQEFWPGTHYLGGNSFLAH